MIKTHSQLLKNSCIMNLIDFMSVRQQGRGCIRVGMNDESFDAKDNGF